MNDQSPSGVQKKAFPDETLPEGSVVEGRQLTADVDETFDYVVVGTGAAGAVAAYTLQNAGFSVAMVEEGPWIKTRDFTTDVFGSFKRMFRDAGTQAIEGRSFIPLLQGRCVGGSTLVNSAIAWRVPDDVVDDWTDRFGLGSVMVKAEIAAHFDALEEDLNVRAVDDAVMGRNNDGFLEASRAHGIESHKMRRYDRGCQGSGRCLQGCPSAAKQGMSVSYVPWALAKGARIFTSCKVERVMMEGRRAVGVLARTSTRSPRTVRVRAKLGVLVAASTIQTPGILRRSGVRAKALGQHFQAHPGIGLGGIMDKPVTMDFGASQGAESVHFRKSDRIKFETLSMPPELLAARMPGAGTGLIQRLAEYPNVCVWGVQVRAESRGTVGTGWGGRDKVTLTLTESDVARARKGLVLLAKLMFDQGAKEIWPGVYGLPTVMTSPDEIKKIEDATLDPRAYGFIATHLFGAARMGADPNENVVGLDFGVHGTDGLYVVDSSVFPTNLGVNPQHTIMMLSRLAATRLAQGRKAQRAA